MKTHTVYMDTHGVWYWLTRYGITGVNARSASSTKNLETIPNFSILKITEGARVNVRTRQS